MKVKVDFSLLVVDLSFLPSSLSVQLLTTETGFVYIDFRIGYAYISAISYFSPVTENVKKTFVNCNDLKEKASNHWHQTNKPLPKIIVIVIAISLIYN